METGLLIRIADYLLDREHGEKALPNFINTIADDADHSLGDTLQKTLYDRDEQCARILSRALGQAFPLELIKDIALNER